jgi:hypothetical protein
MSLLLQDLIPPFTNPVNMKESAGYPRGATVI